VLSLNPADHSWRRQPLPPVISLGMKLNSRAPIEALGESSPTRRMAPTAIRGDHSPEVLLYRPIVQLGAPSDGAPSVPRTGIHFFFSFVLFYPRVPKKPRLAGAPEVGGQLSQKPPAVRTFIVQNGPEWS
jgi:hypothetical protein